MPPTFCPPVPLLPLDVCATPPNPALSPPIPSTHPTHPPTCCSGTFVTELNVREDAERRQLTFSLLESAFMREFVGSWDVRPAAPGDHSGGSGASSSSSGGLTEVRHRLSVRPAVAPPQAVGDITKRIFQRQVVGILSDLQAELDARIT